MKLIKKINNNYAVAIDSSGKTVIVAGSGIGFGKFPMELNDLSKIERTYYNVDDKFVNLIQKLPDEIIKCSSKIVQFAENKLFTKLNPNLVFSLADHISFTLERVKKGITFNYGINYEMNYLHPEEYKIAEEAVKYIQTVFKVKLSKGEIAIIAMHILEAENHSKQKIASDNIEKIVHDLAEIVQNEMNVEFNKSNFNYYRFATHIQYLVERKLKQTEISSDNKKLFDSIKEQYEMVYRCVLKINDYFKEKLNYEICEEEQLYLMIHINRVCSKEDCYR